LLAKAKYLKHEVLNVIGPAVERFCSLQGKKYTLPSGTQYVDIFEKALTHIWSLYENARVEKYKSVQAGKKVASETKAATMKKQIAYNLELCCGCGKSGSLHCCFRCKRRNHVICPGCIPFGEEQSLLVCCSDCFLVRPELDDSVESYNIMQSADRMHVSEVVHDFAKTSGLVGFNVARSPALLNQFSSPVTDEQVLDLIDKHKFDVQLSDAVDLGNFLLRVLYPFWPGSREDDEVADGEEGEKTGEGEKTSIVLGEGDASIDLKSAEGQKRGIVLIREHVIQHELATNGLSSENAELACFISTAASDVSASAPDVLNGTIANFFIEKADANNKATFQPMPDGYLPEATLSFLRYSMWSDVPDPSLCNDINDAMKLVEKNQKDKAKDKVKKRDSDIMGKPSSGGSGNGTYSRAEQKRSGVKRSRQQAYDSACQRNAEREKRRLEDEDAIVSDDEEVVNPVENDDDELSGLPSATSKQNVFESIAAVASMFSIQLATPYLVLRFCR
jgi:hypothetical protein